MAALIATYGYAAVFIGTLLEGETIVVLAGLAAHRGYLALTWVIVAAVAGTMASDQFFFQVGRIKGPAILERRPGWQASAARVSRLVAANETLIILGFRFLYGLRTITPVALGVARVRPAKFVVLNIVGAIAWAVAFSSVGYLSGQALELVLGDIRQIEIYVFALVAAAGGVGWIIRWRRRRKRSAG